MNYNYLYGLTVQGIQSYIFATNKLKEIIGASEIIEEISTKILKEILGYDFDKSKLLLSAAGNVKYVFENKELAKKVYMEFPKKIIGLAGNITFSQAIVNVYGDVTTKDFANLEKKLKANRNKPINEYAASTMTNVINRRTGEFAIKNKFDNEKFPDISTIQKRVKKDATILINKVFGNNPKWKFPKEITEIANNKSFVAIVHADGNKLGVTINNILTSENKNKVELIKNMSLQIEKSTIYAFLKAFDEIIIKSQNFEILKDKEGNIKEQIVPLRPVILGGDDITLIIRADLAVAFTNEYLKAFENEIAVNFSSIGLNEKLTATAGIAFIKEKYPFHYGVHLAESICSYSKNKSNRDYSSLKFYKVQDSFVNDYHNIIEKEYSPNGFDFKKEPYKRDEIDKLLGNLNHLKKEHIAKGSFRDLLTIMYQDKTKAMFRWERIKEIQRDDDIKKLGLSNDDFKTLYDLITLDSLTADN